MLKEGGAGMRLTEHTPNGASLKLDNPRNDSEAREQLMAKWKIAVNKLAAYEDIGLSPEQVAELVKEANNGKT